MKKILVGFLFVSLLYPLVFAQVKDEQIKEFVQVVNVELIVRAISKGKTVSGLTRDDFELRENGIPVEINGFFEKKRRLREQKVEMIDPTQTVSRERRVYFLLFWVFEPKTPVDEVYDRFFETIYQRGDRVIVATPDRQWEVNGYNEIQAVRGKLMERLEVEAAMMHKERRHLLIEMEQLIISKLSVLEMGMQFKTDVAIMNDLERLIAELKAEHDIRLKNFRYRYLMPNLDQLEKFSREIKQIKMDKWILVFYQKQEFPSIKLDGKLRMVIESILLSTGQTDILPFMQKFDDTMHLIIPDHIIGFQKRLQEIFVSTQTTFHIMLLEPGEMHDVANDYYFMKPVFASWEESFREIGQATGGKVIDSNRILDSLEEVVEVEDVYYIITYSPLEQDREKRKVDLKVKQKGVQLFFSPEVELSDISPVVLTNCKWQDGRFFFTLSDFLMISKDKGDTQGDVMMELTAVDRSGRTINATRELNLSQRRVSGSIRLNFPESGKYTLIVRVTDRNTGKSSEWKEEIDVELKE